MKTNKLKAVNLRLQSEALTNILDIIVRELLPEEYTAGTVEVYDEHWESNCPDHTPIYSIGVSFRDRIRFSLFKADEWAWSENIPNGKFDGQISVSEFDICHWYEGSMKNQSFLFMKACLIQHRFNSYIQEYLKNR